MEVLIAGGGVAGLALGIRLRQKGLKPVIIERDLHIRPQIKGEFFQPQGVLVLERMGLLPRFTQDFSVRIHRVSHAYRSPLVGMRHRFAAEYGNYDGVTFGLACQHEDILRVMREEYIAMGGDLRLGISVENLAVSAKGCIVRLSDRSFSEPHIFVGADGRHSPTRKMAGLKPVELECDRVMLAGLVEGLDLPLGEFYTEEIEGGVLYAFMYPDRRARIYLCIDLEELKKATHQKGQYLLRRLEKTMVGKDKPLCLAGPVMVMPTADFMLEKRVLSTGVWIGDAAGTVDPLGGHGMSLALTQAERLANVLEECLPGPQLERGLQRFGEECLEEYLHARYLGVWIGTLFMGPKGAARLGKWTALQRYGLSESLRQEIVDLFSGVHRKPFSLSDIPYYLGLLPKFVRSGIETRMPLKKMQNSILTSPIPLISRRVRRGLLHKVENILVSEL